MYQKKKLFLEKHFTFTFRKGIKISNLL